MSVVNHDVRIEYFPSRVTELRSVAQADWCRHLRETDRRGHEYFGAPNRAKWKHWSDPVPHRGSGQYPWRHCRVTVVVLDSASRGMGSIAGPIEERAQLDTSDSPRIRLDENPMLPRTNTPWSRQLLKAIYFAANRATADFIPNSAIFSALGRSRPQPQAQGWGGSSAKWQSC